MSPNWLITWRVILRAEGTFGPNLESKGKTTRGVTPHVRVTWQKLHSDIAENHGNVTLAIDMMVVTKLSVMTTSRNLDHRDITDKICRLHKGTWREKYSLQPQKYLSNFRFSWTWNTWHPSSCIFLFSSFSLGTRYSSKCHPIIYLPSPIVIVPSSKSLNASLTFFGEESFFLSTAFSLSSIIFPHL